MLYHHEADHEHGGVFVETALVMPLLILVLGGLINFGNTLINLGDVLGAARAGAHVAANYPHSTASLQKKREIYKITRASVEEYLRSSGHDADTFLVNVRTVQYSMPHNNNKHPGKNFVQEAIRVSVKQTGIGSLFTGLFKTAPCGSVVFLREQDPEYLPEDQNKVDALLDDINEGDDFTC